MLILELPFQDMQQDFIYLFKFLIFFDPENLLQT